MDQMKRLMNAGLALALVVGATACVDLDEKLVSSLGADYATSKQGLTDLTNGVYAAVRGYNGGDTYYGMEQMGVDTWTAADQVAAGGAQPWVYLDTYDAQYNSLGAFLNPQWQGAYTIIARANVVLDNGPNTEVGGVLTQAIKDSRMGEARFLRAWAYFQLIQQYGDGKNVGVTVTLHTGSLSTEAVRESEDSVYKVIVDDLTEAIKLLPVTQSEFGRATKGAAQHMLAKVYLTRAYLPWNSANKQADFQKALDLANTVINSGTYSLLPIYADLWCGTHGSTKPADPGRQGFCDVTNNFAENNKEVIWSIQFSYDPVQYTNTATNYLPVVFLSQYDGGAGGWAAGITRVLDDGRPFRRVRPTPFAIHLFNQTRCGGQPCGFGVDVVDTRFDGSYQTVWFANGNTTNPTGTCPKCTSGAAIKGSMLPGSQVGAAPGSDTALVYLTFQVPDSYRQTKAYRIGTPCTTAPGEDCGKDNDAKGMFGYAHYPSLKKFQDNGRTGGYNDTNGGKDRMVFRLGETYLLAAEAAVGLNQPAVAAQNINVLRVRAACDPGPATAAKLCAVSHKSDPAILVSAGQMTIDFIMDEREREMSGELTRWDDVRRPGQAFFLNRVRTWNPYARPNVGDKHYSRPIPQQQIQGVTGPQAYPQNPGW
ncbi:MAG: RagB/SusD family nutrient uptake outer membrane protein [Gemmatimonadetes bacterium]|nr:RagB/SusD family nutrient uptake outer membrane protein [Gemmatimonadota bacterium]